MPEAAPESNAIARDAGAIRKAYQEVMARGGDLVEEGIPLPGLHATYSRDDIFSLVLHGYGELVAEVGDRAYRIIPAGDLGSSRASCRVLTQDRIDGLSQRGIPLNGTLLDGRWREAPMLFAFADLEDRVRSLLGQFGEAVAPRMSFFPTVQFDNYLASKQLGALQSLGIDCDPARAMTYGRFVIDDRPRFLIDTIIAAGQILEWLDPEAELTGNRQGRG